MVGPDKIDEQFWKACLHFFCRGARESADLSALRVAENLNPLLDEVDLPPFTGDMLLRCAKEKAHCW